MEDIPVRSEVIKIEENKEEINSTKEFESEIKKEFTSSQEKLLSFVNEQVEDMKSKALFKGTDPSLEQLNEALTSFEPVLLGLTSLYEVIRWDKNQAQEAFDEFFAEKFIEIRDRVNLKNGPASKYYSSKEIEYMVQNQYKKEIATLKADINLTDGKLSTVNRLINGWSSYQFCITQISKNQIAELDATSHSIDRE